jgi:hypothetical protein
MTDLEPLIPFVFIAAVMALFGAIAYAQWQGEKKRTAALLAMAQRLGFRFEPRADIAMLGPASALHLFTQGRDRQVSNLLAGEKSGVGVRLFDHSYVTGAGKNRKTWRQTAALLDWPTAKLPAFELRPENVFHRIGSAFGYQDIDFPTQPEFSRLFLLRGQDEARVRQAFNVAVLDFFQRHPGVSAEGEGTTLVYYVANKRCPPETTEAFMRDGLELVRRFPRAT